MNLLPDIIYQDCLSQKLQLWIKIWQKFFLMHNGMNSEGCSFSLFFKCFRVCFKLLTEFLTSKTVMHNLWILHISVYLRIFTHCLGILLVFVQQSFQIF